MKLTESPQLGAGQNFVIRCHELFRQYARAINSATSAQESQEVLLFSALGVNMQSVADQALSMRSTAARYMVTRVIAVNRSGGASVACAGGIYSGAAKTGTAIVGAAQSWVTLTAANKLVIAALAAVCATDAQTSKVQYLSLTTGSTAACAADVYVFGMPIPS